MNYEKILADRIGLQHFKDYFIFPKCFTIGTSDVCNAKCTMCPKSLENTNVKALMTDEIFSKIVNELSSYTDWIDMICMNSDGEPLLDKKLDQRIKMLKTTGGGVSNMFIFLRMELY